MISIEIENEDRVSEGAAEVRFQSPTTSLSWTGNIRHYQTSPSASANAAPKGQPALAHNNL